MEDERYFEISKYDMLVYYDSLLTQYFSTLYSVGLNRKDYEEICDFLERHHIRKIDLIYAGYELLQEQFDPDSKWNKPKVQ